MDNTESFAFICKAQGEMAQGLLKEASKIANKMLESLSPEEASFHNMQVVVAIMIAGLEGYGEHKGGDPKKIREIILLNADKIKSMHEQKRQ